MLITVIFVLVLVFFLLLASGVMRTREMEQENRLMQSYMMSMEEFYSGIQNRIEATRRYRHDLAKHIQTLEALLEKREEADGVREYMEDLKQRYATLKKQEFCTDEIVDSILTIKKEQCEGRDIGLFIEVEDVSYTGISEVDMVGLLYNLLDNAVEAQERIPKGERTGVWFSMGKRGEEIVLDMRNCIAPGEKITFRTAKARREEHGIGTKIIENLVEKYQGTIEYSVDEENWEFTEKIVLKQKENENGDA